jgi:hypothetical protein
VIKIFYEKMNTSTLSLHCIIIINHHQVKYRYNVAQFTWNVVIENKTDLNSKKKVMVQVQVFLNSNLECHNLARQLADIRVQ